MKPSTILTARVLCLALVLAACIGQWPTSTHASPSHATGEVNWEHKGFSFPVWDQNSLLDSGPALEDLAATGANSVTFVLTWYTPTVYSTVMQRTGATVSDTALLFAVRKARALGLQVILKPHLDPQDGLWRAYIDPTNVDQWFTNYEQLMNHYADLGEREGASVLVIGAELISMSSNPAYEQYWRAMIDNLRARFSGKLTYSANWGAGDFAEEFTRVRFWDALDYIGISAYFELATTNDPTVESLIASWDRWKTTKIAPFQQRWDKPVLFIEGGYRSIDGAARQPYNAWDIWPLDHQEQVDLYEALFQSWDDVPWFAGTALWAWNVNTNLSVSDIWYEVQNKPAEATITRWFGGNPPVQPALITIRNPESNMSVSGTITVRAVAVGATSVSYRVDERASVPMTYNAAQSFWEATFDTATVANGNHNVTVSARNSVGTVTEDRAWNVRFANTAVTTATPGAATATATRTATPVAATATATSTRTATPVAATATATSTRTATSAPATATRTSTATSVPATATRTATATSTPVGATATRTATAQPARVTIWNPETNTSVSGTITVRAVAAGASSVSYRVDERASVAMTYNAARNVWEATLDTATVANGNHNITVSARNSVGTVTEDRAWNVRFSNTLPTPTSTSVTEPARVTIMNPETNMSVSGTITVRAIGVGATSVSYRVDERTSVAMRYNAAQNVWEATLDTATVANGNHHITVSARNSVGTVTEDRAWNVRFTN